MLDPKPELLLHTATRVLAASRATGGLAKSLRTMATLGWIKASTLATDPLLKGNAAAITLLQMLEQAFGDIEGGIFTEIPCSPSGYCLCSGVGETTPCETLADLVALRIFFTTVSKVFGEEIPGEGVVADAFSRLTMDQEWEDAAELSLSHMFLDDARYFPPIVAGRLQMVLATWEDVLAQYASAHPVAG